METKGVSLLDADTEMETDEVKQSSDKDNDNKEEFSNKVPTRRDKESLIHRTRRAMWHRLKEAGKDKNFYFDDPGRIRKLIRTVEDDLGYKEGNLLRGKDRNRLITRNLWDTSKERSSNYVDEEQDEILYDMQDVIQPYLF